MNNVIYLRPRAITDCLGAKTYVKSIQQFIVYLLTVHQDCKSDRSNMIIRFEPLFSLLILIRSWCIVCIKTFNFNFDSLLSRKHWCS